MALAMAQAFGLRLVNLDEALLAGLFSHMKGEGIDEENVFNADRAGPEGEDWSLLSAVMNEVSLQLARDLFPVNEPTLLVQPGLLARFQLSGFLTQMVEAAERPNSAACLLLLPGGENAGAALINGTLRVPLMGSADVLTVLGEIWAAAQGNDQVTCECRGGGVAAS